MADMPWKANEDGVIEVKDGNPVWIYEGGNKNGQEAPVAFENTLSTITRLTAESVDRKTKLQDANEMLDPLQKAGIENVADYLAQAGTAIETVANLDDKQILDAGEIDKIKQGVKDGYEAKITALEDSHAKTLGEKDTSIEAKDGNIRSLVIRSAFDQSEFLRENTHMLPDVAFSFLGDKFKVESDKKGNPYGYAVDEAGNKLLSLKNPGDVADPLEAIELLINSHPQKDKLLKMESNGSGTPPGGPKGKGEGDLMAKYRAAQKHRDHKTMTVLKRQMAAERIKAPL
jgi:hypothetical protein